MTTRKRKPVVHMEFLGKRTLNSYMLAACGFHWNVVTWKWAYVTCKFCLKRRVKSK